MVRRVEDTVRCPMSHPVILILRHKSMGPRVSSIIPLFRGRQSLIISFGTFARWSPRLANRL
jgi:predicted alpha/beta hydrolase